MYLPPTTPAGHTTLLVVATDLLQSASRDPVLVEPLHTLVAPLITS